MTFDAGGGVFPITTPPTGLDIGRMNFIGGNSTAGGTAIAGAAPFVTPGMPDCDGKITGRLGDTLDCVTAGLTSFTGTTGLTSFTGTTGLTSFTGTTGS